MGVGPELMSRIEAWDRSSRWDRSELGKDLRRLGLSYGEIMELIPMKKSTLATWCREVKLSDEQYAAIKERTYGSRVGIPVDTNWRRRKEVEGIRLEARAEAPSLMSDPLWVAGTVLYWGEGYKTGSSLGMANADPAALRLFMTWSRTYHTPHAEFRARLNIHADNDEAWARSWWQTALDLQQADFTKSFVKPDGTGHRKNHLPYGVCALALRRGADARHRSLAWIEFLAERLGQ
jgi:hypothetical protein